jgi:hypothetical protein
MACHKGQEGRQEGKKLMPDLRVSPFLTTPLTIDPRFFYNPHWKEGLPPLDSNSKIKLLKANENYYFIKEDILNFFIILLSSIH